MLRLSTKGQYGVRAMYEIARANAIGPVTIKKISEEQHVPVAYLVQILNKPSEASCLECGTACIQALPSTAIQSMALGLWPESRFSCLQLPIHPQLVGP